MAVAECNGERRRFYGTDMLELFDKLQEQQLMLETETKKVWLSHSCAHGRQSRMQLVTLQLHTNQWLHCRLASCLALFHAPSSYVCLLS
jgi:hypothetical protein